MEPIDIYNSFNIGSAKRVGRNAKLIYNVAKFGRKGLKVNPATVYIDAVISVGEAISAFYGYQKAKEITTQLNSQLDTLRVAYQNKTVEFKEIEKRLGLDLESDKKLRQQELEDIRKKWITIYKPVYENSLRYLFNLKENLSKIRLEYPHCDRVKDIENKFSEAVEAHVSATLFIIGG